MFNLSRTSILALLFCVLPELYATWSKTEIFPWSSFPMYSKAIAGKNLFQLQVFVRSPSGEIKKIQKYISLRPKYEIDRRIDAVRVFKDGLLPKDQEVLNNFAGILKVDLKKKHKLHGHFLEYQISYWNQFTGQKRNSPDQIKLLASYALD